MSTTISLHVDPDIQRSAEQIFERLGLTASEAVSLFYGQVKLQHGLPFPVELPNGTTMKALDEAQDREKLASFDTLEELYEDLGI